MVATTLSLEDGLRGLAFHTVRQHRGVPLTGWSAALADKFCAAGSDEMGVNVGTGSLFLAPEHSNALLNSARAFSRVADLTTTVDLPKSGKLGFPVVKETSRVTGSRRGGLTAYWGLETQTNTNTRSQLASIKLEGQRLMVLVPATQMLLRTSAFDKYIRTAAAEELAVQLDDVLINGRLGSHHGVIAHPSTVTVSKESGQAAATILQENIVKMVSRFWPYSDGSGVFFCSRTAETEIKQTCSSIIRYADPNPNAGKSRFSLAGYPVIVIEQARPVGTSGDVILADMGQQVLAKSGIQASVSAEVSTRFEADEVIFKFVLSSSSEPLWSSPVLPMNGETATQSPFVVLEAR